MDRPVLLPMMFVVVYLAAKISQVTGLGLFAAIRERFPRWVLVPTVTLAFAGNIIEAAADMAPSARRSPVPIPLIVVAAAAAILSATAESAVGRSSAASLAAIAASSRPDPPA